MRKQTRHLYEFDQFRLDVAGGQLWKNGEAIALPNNAVQLLILLVTHHGEVVSKDFLLSELWPDVAVQESSLTQNIYVLRKTLGQTAAGDSFIETFSKRGYKFVPPVTVVAPTPDPPVTLPPTPEPPAPAITTMGPGPRIKPLAIGAIALILAVAGVLLWMVWRDSARVRVDSLAVLPFKTMNAAGNEAFLGPGMAETLTARLSKTGLWRVAAMQAVQRFVDKGVDPIEIGRALQVESVLSGTVQQNGDRLRVTVLLVAVRDGRTLWAEVFDEKFFDVLVVQDVLAERLARTITVSLKGAKAQPLPQPETSNVQAYQAYMKGRYFWNKRSPEWIAKAIACFEEATQLDPHYARAFAGLADSYALSNSGLPPLERLPKAKAAVQRALELDDTLAEAHASLGLISYKYNWDWAGAENSFRRAIKLNPSYATAVQWHGEMLSLVGRFEEAIALLKQAEVLDPLSTGIKHDLGEAYYRARRYEEAKVVAKEIEELDPATPHSHYLYWQVHQAQGRLDQAVLERKAYLGKRKTPANILDQLEEARRTGGPRAYWSKELSLASAGLLPLNSNEYTQVNIYLGNYEQAFQWIEKSFAEHGDVPLVMKTLPVYDPLRKDPRFEGYLRRAGYSPGVAPPSR